MSVILPRLKQALHDAQRVLAVTHINPDGDAIGSLAAAAHIALHMGCEVRLLLHGPLPDFLSWLPLPAPVVRSVGELGDWRPDLLLSVDCSDAARLGPELGAPANKGKPLPNVWDNLSTINIDHHISNPGFAGINWIEPERAATGELMGMLAEYLGLPLKGDLGEAVYLALASDTGNFTYSNTSAESLAMASRIVEAGLNVASFTNNYENTWSLNRMHLWGRLMSEITLHADGAVACSIVRLRYLKELNLGKAALEGYASWLRRLRGVRVGLFVREDAHGLCKISLRSMGDVDVQAVTALFGGGGHAAAAGAEIALPPEQAAQRVLAAVIERL